MNVNTKNIHQLLIDRNETLSLVETCTGGALTEHLTQTPGASQWYLGTLIPYCNQLKQQLLNVDLLIEKHGAVSELTAFAMAQAFNITTNATYTMAITGIAGPSGGCPEKPVGTLCIAVAGQSNRQHTYYCQGTRHNIRHQSVQLALDLLWRTLND